MKKSTLVSLLVIALACLLGIVTQIDTFWHTVVVVVKHILEVVFGKNQKTKDAVSDVDNENDDDFSDADPSIFEEDGDPTNLENDSENGGLA